MEGFYAKQDNTSLEKVKQRSSELSLLAKGKGTEIMHQKILPQKVFNISPSDKPETMEFFYVLKGSLLLEKNEENLVIKEGDYFYTNRLKEIVFFKTLSEVELLYVSNEPIFHNASNKIKELMGIVEKVEKKDKYTHNHGKRVQEYSEKIAKKLKTSNESLELLLFASLFHDIGKIHVPDEILNKPVHLTKEEFDHIKKHPLDGEKLVDGTFLVDIGKVIIQHHEKLDGTGYPYGLKGDQICFEARIISVTDIYDAMTSDRPYRKGLSPTIAIEELTKNSGTKYDERIINVLIEILEEEGKI